MDVISDGSAPNAAILFPVRTDVCERRKRRNDHVERPAVFVRTVTWWGCRVGREPGQTTIVKPFLLSICAPGACNSGLQARSARSRNQITCVRLELRNERRKVRTHV